MLPGSLSTAFYDRDPEFDQSRLVTDYVLILAIPALALMGLVFIIYRKAFFPEDPADKKRRYNI